jgi:hypothetical protein
MPRPNLVALGRKPRCRVLNRTNDRCENEVIDPDPAAPQLCVHHAYQGAKLLEESGALTLLFAVPPSMRSDQ